MYHFEIKRPDQIRHTVQQHKKSSISRSPVQMKQLKDCTMEEVAPYQPLLWSREKFDAFLHFFRDREIGDPAYSETIMNLIKKFNSPQVIHGFGTTANFRMAPGLPPAFFSAPRSVENIVLRVDDVFHLQLGFRSIAVLARIPRSSQYRIVKILKYNRDHFDDETGLALDRYEDSLSRRFQKAAEKKDQRKAKTTMDKLAAFQRKKDNISIAGVVTAQVSSCTFAAMTDRDERYAVVMHLDGSTPANAAGIRDILLKAGVPDVKLENLFISRVEGAEEEAKQKEIYEMLGMQKSGIPMLHQTQLNRGDCSNFMAMQHQLIGVDFSRGKATIHGSLGELALPGTTQDAAIRTGAQKAVMYLAQNITRDSYELFCSPPIIYPFSAGITEIIRKQIPKELYEIVKKKNPLDTYRQLLKRIPQLLELLSIYDASFFSMELLSENPV